MSGQSEIALVGNKSETGYLDGVSLNTAGQNSEVLSQFSEYTFDNVCHTYTDSQEAKILSCNSGTRLEPHLVSQQNFSLKGNKPKIGSLDGMLQDAKIAKKFV